MVTEAVFGSVDNIVNHFEGIPNITRETKETKMSQLEIKHGLLQVLLFPQGCRSVSVWNHCILVCVVQTIALFWSGFCVSWCSQNSELLDVFDL